MREETINNNNNKRETNKSPSANRLHQDVFSNTLQSNGDVLLLPKLLLLPERPLKDNGVFLLPSVF